MPAGSITRRAGHAWRPVYREIAVVLRDITDLRAEHELNAAESAGPMTSAVLEPHQRAVRLALDAISSRVTALERYAAETGAAATAYLDWQEAMRVSEMNDRYLDLVARTAADEHAVAEIGGLTEHATAAARAFRDTIGQMSQAAAALALPEPDTGQARAAELSARPAREAPFPAKPAKTRPGTA